MNLANILIGLAAAVIGLALHGAVEPDQRIDARKLYNKQLSGYHD